MILKQITRNILNQSKRISSFTIFQRNFHKNFALNSEIQLNQEIVNKVPKKNYQEINGKSSVITNFLVSVKSKNQREKSKMMLLEGKRLIQDGIDAGMQPIALFFSRYWDIHDLDLDEKVNLYRIAYKDLQFWSELSTTQGVMAIFPIPDVINFSRASKLPLTIICDNVRDPGNLGSILRTSAAVGCSKILLTKGCVDLWDPKVLRSASGAHFRLNINFSVPWNEILDHLPDNFQVFLADSDIPEPEDVSEVYELKDGVKIPINEESKRKTLYQNRPSSDLKQSVIEYTSADYTEAKEIVLILGGETQGLSQDAYQLGSTKQGTRIYVPMANGVESLNSGTALGILVYEIRRQRLIN